MLSMLLETIIPHVAVETLMTQFQKNFNFSSLAGGSLNKFSIPSFSVTEAWKLLGLAGKVNGHGIGPG